VSHRGRGVARERRREKISEREKGNGGKRKKKGGGGAGQLWATCHPPLLTCGEEPRHHLVTCGTLPRGEFFFFLQKNF
jgi:hypothetical protein